jgi:uncharacterized protein
MSASRLKSLIQDCRPVVQALIREQGRFSQVFRDRYEHTLRVLTWAERIQECEGGDMTIISLAVLFHDTGWSETINHAAVSAGLVEKYLKEHRVEPDIVERIASAVSTHNLRELPKETLALENRIVMDADLLDELGVTTLVWDALAAAGEPDPGYQKVFEKNQDFYARAIQKTSLLKTNTGLMLYRERMEFWKSVLENYAFELGLSGELAKPVGPI